MAVAENERDALISLFSERGWPVDGQKADQLMTYYRMLVEKNRVMNLTRITGFQDALIKHFADSLMIADHVDLDHVGTVLDLGSGAGFPGAGDGRSLQRMISAPVVLRFDCRSFA